MNQSSNSSITEEKFTVKGMTCPSCERRVESVLHNKEGIHSVRASFSANTVVLGYDKSKISLDTIVSILSEEDYILLKTIPLDMKDNSPTAKPPSSNQTQARRTQLLTVKQFALAILTMSILYFLILNTIGFDFIPSPTSNMGYGFLFVIGLLTSLHCIAMCGGINVSQCVSYKTKTSKSESTVFPSLLYNLGRVISYTVIGGIVGALGSLVTFSGWARGFVALLAGFFMLLVAINLLGIFPELNKLSPKMPRFIRIRALRFANKSSKNKGPLYIGLVNGFMPCGPLQAMQLYALGTGSFLLGALSMFFFSLGTVPLMFGLGLISTFLGRKFTKNMYRFSAVLVFFLGIIMINRGLALSGISLLPTTFASSSSTTSTTSAISPDDIPHLELPASKNSVASELELTEAFQEVTTELTPQGYPQITVMKGIPVKWNFHVDEGLLNGCNRTLIIPAFDISIDLVEGDNLIEFTPTDSGTIPFSCWMGMITSQININE